MQERVFSQLSYSGTTRTTGVPAYGEADWDITGMITVRTTAIRVRYRVRPYCFALRETAQSHPEVVPPESGRRIRNNTVNVIL